MSTPFARLISLNPHISHINLEADVTTLGRGAACDHQLSSELISNVHVKFINRGDDIIVHDLSRNGTYIDRTTKIGKGKEQILINGQEVSLVCPKLRRKEENRLPGYELARELGAGSFGVVWLAVANQRGGGAAPAVDSCEMPTEVAIKMIAKQHLGNAAARAKVLEEARMLHRLRHPNIIRIFDVMETQSRILLVLECAKGGDLSDLLSKHDFFNESAARLCMHQVFTALQYLHEQNVVHRDLKPENVLLMEEGAELPVLKLTDFGLARALGARSMATTICGTPLYIAPEVINQEVCAMGYGPAADLWSAGIMLYEMLTGTVPFDCTSSTPLHSQILMGLRPGFRLQCPDSIPADAQHLLRCLIAPPVDRITAAEALQHRWFTGGATAAQKRKRKGLEIGGEAAIALQRSDTAVVMAAGFGMPAAPAHKATVAGAMSPQGLPGIASPDSAGGTVSTVGAGSPAGTPSGGGVGGIKTKRHSFSGSKVQRQPAMPFVPATTPVSDAGTNGGGDGGGDGGGGIKHQDIALAYVRRRVQPDYAPAVHSPPTRARRPTTTNATAAAESNGSEHGDGDEVMLSQLSPDGVMPMSLDPDDIPSSEPDTPPRPMAVRRGGQADAQPLPGLQRTTAMAFAKPLPHPMRTNESDGRPTKRQLR